MPMYFALLYRDKNINGKSILNWIYSIRFFSPRYSISILLVLPVILRQLALCSRVAKEYGFNARQHVAPYVSVNFSMNPFANWYASSRDSWFVVLPFIMFKATIDPVNAPHMQPDCPTPPPNPVMSFTMEGSISGARSSR